MEIYDRLIIHENTLEQVSPTKQSKTGPNNKQVGAINSYSPKSLISSSTMAYKMNCHSK